MNVSDSTNEGYMVERINFKKWKEESVESMKVINKVEERKHTGDDLKTLVDSNMKLEPTGQRFSTKPKYSMSAIFNFIQIFLISILFHTIFK